MRKALGLSLIVGSSLALLVGCAATDGAAEDDGRLEQAAGVADMSIEEAALDDVTPVSDDAGSGASSANWIYHGESYGYAGATFDWKGPGWAGNIDLTVADWGCDAKPVYAYFVGLHTDGTSFSTSTRRYDYSGCDTGDHTNYNDLQITSGKNIAYLAVVICKDDFTDTCRASGWSDRNPYA